MKTHTTVTLNEEALFSLENEEADSTWRDGYSDRGRIAYMRRYRYQFEACSFAELLACARGKFFMGYASELVNR